MELVRLLKNLELSLTFVSVLKQPQVKTVKQVSAEMNSATSIFLAVNILIDAICFYHIQKVKILIYQYTFTKFNSRVNSKSQWQNLEYTLIEMSVQKYGVLC